MRIRRCCAIGEYGNLENLIDLMAVVSDAGVASTDEIDERSGRPASALFRYLLLKSPET